MSYGPPTGPRFDLPPPNEDDMARLVTCRRNARPHREHWMCREPQLYVYVHPAAPSCYHCVHHTEHTDEQHRASAAAWRQLRTRAGGAS
jgi:hypothetical protein